MFDLLIVHIAFAAARLVRLEVFKLLELANGAGNFPFCRFIRGAFFATAFFLACFFAGAFLLRPFSWQVLF